MANGYTVFITYLLKPTVVAGGYSPSVHCNYIQSLLLDTTIPDIEEVRIIFPEETDFKFLSTGLTTGTGYTANYLYAVVQLVNNAPFASTADVKPDASKWKVYDLTPQIPGHVSGATITPTELTSVVFKVALNAYNNPAIFVPYTLNNIITGINYPSRYSSADNLLCFGDETFFLGNVSAEIHADVYTTNLSLILPANKFNSTTNATWDGLSSVYATEVGIYDGNGNLVAIGKFNDPVEKSPNISRTILFAIDF